MPYFFLKIINKIVPVIIGGINKNSNKLISNVILFPFILS